MTAQVNQHDPQGREHGVWEDYWANGTLWWRRHYLHGKGYGLSEWYKRTGTLRTKEYFLTIK
jgi:hypothetical protein